MSNQENRDIITIDIINYPIYLLIPNNENKFSFHLINNSVNSEKAKVSISGENLKVNVPNITDDILELQPSSKKEIDVELTPVIDGAGKLIIDVDIIKEVKYSIKVQKIREQVEKTDFSRIFNNYKLKCPKIKGDFNPEKYKLSMSKKEFKETKKDLETKLELFYESESTNSDIKKPSIKEIDKLRIKLIKSYLGLNKPKKSLTLLKDLSVDKKKKKLQVNILRAYANIDIENTVNLGKEFLENQEYQELLENIIKDTVHTFPEKSLELLTNIYDDSIRNDLKLLIFCENLETHPDLMLESLAVYNDEAFKIKILFNLIEKNYTKEEKRDFVEHLIAKVIGICTEEDRIFKNKNSDIYYNPLRDIIHFSAIYVSPKKADEIIQNITLRELIEKIAKDLFDIIYIIVDEIRIKKEPVSVLSQFYLFNTFTSDLRKEFSLFSRMGGNVSSNLLEGHIDFNKIFISLFSYDFSIFPTLERLLNDLRYNQGKGFGYYILPTNKNFNETEFDVIERTLEGLVKSKLRSQNEKITLFNFDFISYLGKPTIFLSSPDDNEINKIQARIKSTLGNVNLIINSDMFTNGDVTEILQIIFTNPNFKVINLVLSYEFLSDYEILRRLMEIIV
ncbi:MAG: hypothetical protein P8Y70_19845 [Candidatus Lokiarchaeota archaeon]